MIFLLLPVWTGAQKFFYTIYHTAQGLPAQQVRATLQDSSGFLWVATDDGLARFDGREFRTYRRLLESQYIKALAPESAGSFLLINDSGLYRLRPRVDTLFTERLLIADPVPSDSTLHYPNGLFRDSRGRLWISQPDGRLARREGGALRFYDFGKSHATGYSDSHFSMAEDVHGSVWLAATTGQLYVFEEREDRFRRVRPPDPPARIRDLRARGDTLWVAGDARLGRFLTGPDGQLRRSRYYDLQGYEANCLTLDTLNSALYIGMRGGGLFRLQFQGRTTVIQRVFGSNDPHRVEELPFRHINHIHLDREGSLWLGTLQGLGLLQSRFFESVFGLANNNTFVVTPYRKDDILLSFGDVYELNRERSEYFGQVLPGLDRRLITAIATVGADIWMGTTNGELIRYEDGRVVERKDLTGRGAGIFYLAPDHRGSLWISQAPSETPIVGVARRMPDGELRLYGPEKGLDNRILVVAESDRHLLYAAGIGPETYLYRYREAEDDFINLSLALPFEYSQNFEVHDLAIDERGVVWLGTTDGLLRYDLERIQRVDLGELTGVEIRSVVCGTEGSVWLSTDTHGVLYYRDGRHVLLDEESGLPTRITAYRCLVRDPSGRIWVGTAEGIVHSRDEQPYPERTVTPVLLSLEVNGRKVDRAEGVLDLRSNPVVDLSVRALAFPGREVQYQHRLLGSPDSSWSEARPQPDLRLSRLPYGDYRLEVRALRPGGYDWSEPLVLPFHIRKVWYRRWWAITLLTGGGLLLLYYFFQFNIGRLLQRIRRLEAALALRDEAIRQKEDQLEEQSRELAARARDLRQATVQLSHQREEISLTLDHLQLLHRLIQKIPRNSTWEHTIEAISETLEGIENIQAFEFGFFEKDDMHFKGYSWRRNGYLRRQTEFNEKTDLAVWALVHKQPVRIADFRQEHGQFIEETDAYQFHSLIALPFELPGRQHLVLVVYGLRKRAFHNYDQMMLQIFVDYLSMAVQGVLKS